MPLQMWSEEELSARISDRRPLLVDLHAEWCSQCGPQTQVLARIAPDFEESVLMGTVDVGAYPTIADRFGVSSLPALLLFRDGELRETLCGFKRAPLVRAALVRLIEEDD